MLWYRRVVVLLSVVFVVIGAALLAVTAAGRGDAVGYALGGVFIAVGTARVAAEWRRRSQTRQ